MLKSVFLCSQRSSKKSQSVCPYNQISFQPNVNVHDVCCHTSKQQTWLKIPAREQHSSLLFQSINDEEKSLKLKHLGQMLYKFLRPQFTNIPNQLVFVPGKPLQPSLILVGKVRSLPLSGVHGVEFKTLHFPHN